MAAAITLARAYQHSFETHPHMTLSLTGGCLNALGDCVAQIAEGTVGGHRGTLSSSRHSYNFGSASRRNRILGTAQVRLIADFPLLLLRRDHKPILGPVERLSREAVPTSCVENDQKT